MWPHLAITPVAWEMLELIAASSLCHVYLLVAGRMLSPHPSEFASRHRVAVLFGFALPSRVLRPAAFEEAVFRGPLVILFHSGLSTGAVIGTILSSAIFAVAHKERQSDMPNAGLRRLAMFVLGVGLGVAGVSMNSLWPCFAAHCLWNFGVLCWLSVTHTRNPSELTGFPQPSEKSASSEVLFGGHIHKRTVVATAGFAEGMCIVASREMAGLDPWATVVFVLKTFPITLAAFAAVFESDLRKKDKKAKQAAKNASS